jgi:predicted unusual protein kinase regulating ubiquinone biosynthesis (AarF/ABC1/UbiB family)
VLVLASAASAYAFLRKTNDTPEIIPIPQSVINLEEEFQHPLNKNSWYWRMYFKTKRFLYLFAVFLPCVTMAAIVHVTESERMRAYLLVHLVEALHSAGCGFQKFGQWLSMRPDLFPPDVIKALANLRQDTPAHSMAHTRKILKDSFNCEIEEMFEEFDPIPVASGTVAQVHRARLREKYAEDAKIRGPEGELIREVAVKVRHPHVIEETFVDIDLMYKFLEFTHIFAVPFTKDDFLHALQKQIDFKWEAHNLVQFTHNFKNEIRSGQLRFPVVSTDLLSTSVLLESWAPGKSVSSILCNVGEGFREKVVEMREGLKQKKRALASTLFDMSIKMFLRDNLVHGDLHAGNVMFDVVGDTCTVIDGGMTTSLAPSVKKDFGLFLQALCTSDTDLLIRKILTFHVEPEIAGKRGGAHIQGGISSTDPVERKRANEALVVSVTNTMNRFVVKNANGTISGPNGRPISLGDIVGEVMFSLQTHGVCLRGDVANSLMTMSLTEGLIRSLDPEFDMVKSSYPYFLRYRGSDMTSTFRAVSQFV